MACQFTGSLSLDPATRAPYHPGMQVEIQGLSDQIERLIAMAARLADEKQALTLALEESRRQQQLLQHRLEQARSHVASALARIPATGSDEEDDHGAD